jgi:hypothetical protein
MKAVRVVLPASSTHDEVGMPSARQGLPALTRTRRRSTLERMPKWLICVPLTLQWLCLAVRYRSLSLPSAANPSLTSGGLVGEGKLEYFDIMGPLARAVTARSCGVTAIHPPDAGALQRAMRTAALSFPVMAKPNLGLCGYGVRRLDDEAALLAYMAAFPQGETVVLQQYLPQEGEAGIFYARDPATGCGRIIGLALRYFPQVVGDGHSTLGQLMSRDARCERLCSTPRHEFSHDRRRVPKAGEVVRLSTIGSTRVGGLYRNGAGCITPALTAAVDAIARDMRHFHVGRFDVRIDSLQALAAGQGFTIMEVNGAGSEAIQAWDPDIGLWAGLRMIFAKQALLFAIGDAQRAQGVRPVGVWALHRLNQRQNGLVRRYPRSN